MIDNLLVEVCRELTDRADEYQKMWQQYQNNGQRVAQDIVQGKEHAMREAVTYIKNKLGVPDRLSY